MRTVNCVLWASPCSSTATFWPLTVSSLTPAGTSTLKLWYSGTPAASSTRQDLNSPLRESLTMGTSTGVVTPSWVTVAFTVAWSPSIRVSLIS